VKYVSAPTGADIVDQVHALVSAAAGEVLVFVDTSIHLESCNWLREIAGPLLLPGVGLSGCQLEHYPSGELSQIGIAFDSEGSASRVRARFAGAEFLHGWNYWLRNWSAASGACFAIQRSTWDEVGGFSAPNGHSRPDIRLCLKLAEKGLRVVTSPAVRLGQAGIAALERPLRVQEEEDRRIVRSILPHGDPCINPNLRLEDGIAVPSWTFRF
jgi:cellulose synthase/poly-beta-1,6-N-acetylglucosamine synthase-like glycosyltransferase